VPPRPPCKDCLHPLDPLDLQDPRVSDGMIACLRVPRGRPLISSAAADCWRPLRSGIGVPIPTRCCTSAAVHLRIRSVMVRGEGRVVVDWADEVDEMVGTARVDCWILSVGSCPSPIPRDPEQWAGRLRRGSVGQTTGTGPPTWHRQGGRKYLCAHSAHWRMNGADNKRVRSRSVESNPVSQPAGRG
jgi:hypothetical protein